MDGGDLTKPIKSIMSANIYYFNNVSFIYYAEKR